MKQFFILFLLLFIPFGMNAQMNDIYYVPKKKAKDAPKNNDASQMSLQTTQERFTSSRNGRHGICAERDEDEYNRRYMYSGGTADIEEESDDVIYDEQDGVDYVYSSRIVRFHSPRMVVTSRPWYWDVVYTSGADNWIVSDDGVYWDVYPSYVYSS